MMMTNGTGIIGTRRGRVLAGKPCPSALKEIAGQIGYERALTMLSILYSQISILSEWVDRFINGVKEAAERSGIVLRAIKVPCAGGCRACQGRWRVHCYWQRYDNVRGDYVHIHVSEEREFLCRVVSEKDYEAWLWVNEARLTLLFLYTWLREFEISVGIVSEGDFQ